MTTDMHDYREQTLLVRGGLERSGFDETSEALFLTSGYVYKTAEEAEAAFKGDRVRYVYSRYANPTVSMFEERLARLEGAAFCQATASGMSAVFSALFCQLKAGDRLVASRALFGSCLYIVTDILPSYGVETELVDGVDLDQWRKALSKPAQAVFLETPSNPTLEVIDIKAVCDLAHAAGARVVVDNVFATPMLQKPMLYGADIVIYSTTKHIDGQGRCLGGAILYNDTDFRDQLLPIIRHTGPSMSPFNAWVMLKGMETMALRVDRHCDNALAIARSLEGQPGLNRVIYPQLESHPQHKLAMSQMSSRGSTIVSLDLDGGKERTFRFLNALKLIDLSNNVGDSKSLITHPATTTHQRLSPEEREMLNIGDGLVRLSVGLEDVEDLKADITQALKA